MTNPYREASSIDNYETVDVETDDVLIEVSFLDKDADVDVVRRIRHQFIGQPDAIKNGIGRIDKRNYSGSYQYQNSLKNFDRGYYIIDNYVIPIHRLLLIETLEIKNRTENVVVLNLS